MATYAGVRVSDSDALRLRGFDVPARSWQPTEFRADEPDEMVDALLWAIAELAGEHRWQQRDEHFEELHPRGPGGKFRTIAERVLHALKQHHASGGKGPDPLKDFNREQLRKVAKGRGIDLPRGASIEHIKAALIEHSASKIHAPGGKADVVSGKPDLPAKKAVKKAVPDTPNAPAPSKAAGRESIRPDLRKRLNALAAEGAPIGDEIAKDNESSGPGGGMEFHRRRQRLQKLVAEGSTAAHDLLTALTEHEGQPWGGDAATDASRWRDVSVGHGSFNDRHNLDPAAWQKIRDRYVITDRNTVMQNASLRSDQPTAAAEAWAKQMARMVQSSELTHDTKLHRGAALRPDQIIDLKPGAVIHDRGFVSTAGSAFVHGSGAGEANFYAETRLERMPGTIKTMFEIRAPKGTPAANVGQGEVVLNRNGRFRIVSSRLDADGTVHVVMELLT